METETKDKENSWKEFLDLYKNNLGDKTKTINEFGIDHKIFNYWYYTIPEFGQECNKIETMRNNSIEDELYDILLEQFESLLNDGFEFKDCVRYTGFDPNEYRKRISGKTIYTYSRPLEYWDKYKVNFHSNNPEDLLDYHIEYRKKILKLRESRFNRNTIIKDKRKKRLDEIRSKLRDQDPTNKILKTNDEVIDWEIEKILKRTDKKIKVLEERIEKERLIELERQKSRELEQGQYKKVIKEIEKIRIEKLQDIENKKIERLNLKEEERKKRELEKQSLYNSRLENRKLKKIERENLKNKIKQENYLSRLELTNKSQEINLVSKFNFSEFKKDVLKQVIPKEFLEKVKKSNELGTKLYDINDKVVFQKCSGCDEYKGREHFHRKGKSDLVNYCIECTRKRMGLDPDGGRRGETYKGKIIKKYNKNGNETHRRCTSCDEFYPTNDFRYKYRTSSICKNCYVDLPNNHLTKPGEYNSLNKQIRWFDLKSFEVTHKRCNLCEKKKKRIEFTMRTKSTDGLSNRCKPCEKIVRDEKKNSN